MEDPEPYFHNSFSQTESGAHCTMELSTYQAQNKTAL